MVPPAPVAPPDPAPEVPATEDLAPQLRVAVTRLFRRLRQQSVAGLSPAQLSALATVSRQGSPTLGELAVAEQVQPPTVTRLVAALEEQGLVARQADPADRRICRVTVTSEGRRALARTRSMRTSFLAAHLEQLPEAERRALAAALPVLLALAEAP